MERQALAEDYERRINDMKDAYERQIDSLEEMYAHREGEGQGVQHQATDVSELMRII